MQIIDGHTNAGQQLDGLYRNNEDWMAFGRNFAAVFDGATFKGQSSIATNHFTDAAWCAQTAGHILSSIIRITHKPDVIYTDICEKLGRAYQAATKIDPASIDYNRRPSTTMSCAIQFGNTVRIIQIGDSPIIIEHMDGRIEEFLGDPVLLRQDEAIRKEIQDLWSGNPDSSYDAIMRLRQNPSIRHQMNIASGYGVLTVVKPTTMNMTVKDFDANEVKAILMATDGLAEAYDTFTLFSSPKELLKAAQNQNGLRDMIKSLRQAQLEDRDCKIHPRAKIGDDVTALLIKPSL